MNSKTCMRIIALALFAALVIPLGISAQDETPPFSKPKHHHYKLIDIGTFGGSASYFSNGFDGILNHHGTAVGWADTSAPDPFPMFCFNPTSTNCFVAHAFQWKDSVQTDLGALPGGASSQAIWIANNGLIAGNSQNGEQDPLFPGFGEFRAVIWKDGDLIDLGTLDGGYESFMGSVNSKGEVAGLFMNAVPDPFNLNGPGFFPT